MIAQKEFIATLPEPDESTTLSESVAQRKIFFRLGDSEIFDYINKNTTIGGQPTVNVLPRMVVEGQGFFHVAYSQLDKSLQYELFEGPRYKISCKREMRRLLESGAVNMVYSEQYKIHTCIPYIIQGQGSKARIFVNVSDFLVMDTYGKYQINNVRSYNGLMSVLVAACASLKLMQTSNAAPADLSDGMVLVYAAMMERTINSIVHMDPIARDKVRYFAAEFYLVQMYGTEEGQRMFYQRYKNKYFPKLTKLMTESMDAQFHVDSFDKFSLFILELKNLYPSMKGLTDYMVMDKWIRSFGTSTALTIDYPGYHLYTICMVLFESSLVTRMALEPVMEKHKGTDMYRRIQNIIGE